MDCFSSHRSKSAVNRSHRRLSRSNQQRLPSQVANPIPWNFSAISSRHSGLELPVRGTGGAQAASSNNQNGRIKKRTVNFKDISRVNCRGRYCAHGAPGCHKIKRCTTRYNAGMPARRHSHQGAEHFFPAPLECLQGTA
jgi:hypothetical protein